MLPCRCRDGTACRWPAAGAHCSSLVPIAGPPSCMQILLVAAVVDLFIALASGERGWGAFVEPLVILLILVANGEGSGLLRMGLACQSCS